ncbi:MAG: acyl carrier protein [Magnetococcales bacterium]|nr:acyl carrier protein [Magnetococcales bacterium]MBF0420107.1 acyl carrier protein [Magnetococcales bacterium]
MTPEEILQRLQPIMHQVFQDDRLIVTATLSLEEIPAWDSISHMALITATEQAFGCAFSLDELVKVGSVGDLLTLIRAKLG